MDSLVPIEPHAVRPSGGGRAFVAPRQRGLYDRTTKAPTSCSERSSTNGAPAGRGALRPAVLFLSLSVKRGFRRSEGATCVAAGNARESAAAEGGAGGAGAALTRRPNTRRPRPHRQRPRVHPDTHRGPVRVALFGNVVM
ncbi:hypothetical protein EVAR_12911_1 [Eumeta japonica]|uniref:Uncharacterized protein n=1 Tax=Eumeta variegata TaxID=151549 RepID=A0A4C1TVV6_EUMVA|nr:hypothetical protein EVAR_12911_1 [Eumeta japonica]